MEKTVFRIVPPDDQDESPYCLILYRASSMFSAGRPLVIGVHRLDTVFDSENQPVQYKGLGAKGEIVVSFPAANFSFTLLKRELLLAETAVEAAIRDKAEEKALEEVLGKKEGADEISLPNVADRGYL